jgi:serine/threonine protein kinase
MEYDYNYISPKRKKIVELIAKNYYELTKKDMKLCELDIRTLKDVVTLKKEKKGDTNFSRMPTSSLISLSALLYGTIDDSLRKKSAMVFKSDSIYGKRKIGQIFNNLDDIRILKVIGKGNFSKVFLIEAQSRELLALKVIRKDAILILDLVASIQMEKKILSSIENPFIMAMTNCIQTDDHICIVMPFVPGGDLYEMNRRDDCTLTEDTYMNL